MADASMNAEQFDVGDFIRATCRFRDGDHELADPSTISIQLRAPSGTVTTLSYDGVNALTRESLGIYHYDFTTTESGRCRLKWIGEGDVTAVFNGHFYVEPD